MKVIVLVLSAVSVVCGSHAGYPSSYSSNAGAQLHPQEWQDASSVSQHGWAPQQKIIYPQHVPVIHNGVPVETPEVQAAKAHFYHEYQRAAALAAQKPDPLDGQYAGDHGHEKYLPVSHGWTAEKRVSYEQPEVWQNQQEYTNVAYDSNAYTHQVYDNNQHQAYDNNQHQAYDHSAYDHSAYVPKDTPEVQHAKVSHFKAFAAALARASAPRKHQQHRYRRSATEWAEPKYQGPIHVPHITAEGVPADTPEVQKAKWIHQQALTQAAALAHSSGHHEEDHSAWQEEKGHQQTYGPPQSAGWPSAPVHTSYKVNHDHTPKWHGPEHMPVLDHNGVPYDTPEVQHARKAHLATLAAESLKHKGWEPEPKWQEEKKW